MTLFKLLLILSLTTFTMAFSTSIELEKEALESLPEKGIAGSKDQIIYHFCKGLLNKALPEAALEERELIGQILYLYERNPDDTLLLIDPLEPNATKTRVTLRFAKAMSGISQELMQAKIAHQLTAFQNPSITSQEHLSKAVAHALITSAGTLNIDIAKPLKKNLFPSPSLGYQKEISRFLDLLTEISQHEGKAEEWETLFQNVRKPLKEDSPSGRMIRATLGLSPEAPLTDRHAKEAFLYFFMGSIRESSVGNCFSAWWTIFLEDRLWHTLAKEGIELLKYSGLVKNIEGTPQTFPFTYAIEDDNLSNEAVIDPQGKLRTGGHLFDAPGIQRAAEQMGIAHLGAFSAEILPLLSGAKTAKDIISKLADVSIQHKLNRKKDIETLKNIGFYAFSTESNCAPLEMHKNASAYFTQTMRGNLPQKAFLHAVELSLDSQWDRGALPLKLPTIQKFKELFFATLNTQCRLSFNPAIPQGGISTTAAFEMRTLNGARITGPAEFQKCILDVLKMAKAAAEEQSKKNLLTPMMVDWMRESADKIASYIRSSPNFLKLTLWNYHPDNKKHLDPHLEWSKMQHTPWIDHAQDNPPSFEMAATEEVAPLITVTPRNAYQLLTGFIEFAKALENSDHYLANAEFIGKVPVFNTLHTYRGLLDDPGMLDAVQSPLSTQEWVARRLLIPGHMVALSPIPRATAATLLQEVAQRLSPSDRQILFSKANTLYEESMNIRDFSRQLIKAVTRVSPKYSGTHIYQQISLLVTSILLKILPKDQTAPLLSSAVPTFDTNWRGVEEKELLLCFFFDPVSEEILLGAIDEDDKELTLIDKSESLVAQPWEFVPAVLTERPDNPLFLKTPLTR